MVETTQQGETRKVAVDLGRADQLKLDIKKGSNLIFTGLPVKVNEKLLMIAQSVQQDGPSRPNQSPANGSGRGGKPFRQKKVERRRTRRVAVWRAPKKVISPTHEHFAFHAHGSKQASRALSNIVRECSPCIQAYTAAPELATRYEAGLQTEVFNPQYEMTFVKDPENDSALHKSNHALAERLNELAAKQKAVPHSLGSKFPVEAFTFQQTTFIAPSASADKPLAEKRSS